MTSTLVSICQISEGATEHDVQSWFNLTVVGNFNKQLVLSQAKYWLENQERVGEDSTHFTQTLLRTGLGYAFTENTSIWLGYAWIRTGAPLTPNPFTEDRIWQQWLWIKTNEDLKFTSRTRTEQRFLATSHKTAYRVRQLAKLVVPFKSNSVFSFVSFDELFWHKNDFVGRNGQGFDQNRWFIGLGYQLNSKITSEIGYMNQYIRRFGVPNFCANILSVNFFIES